MQGTGQGFAKRAVKGIEGRRQHMGAVGGQFGIGGKATVLMDANGAIVGAQVWLAGSAKRAGADAIKLQTYTADTITLDAKTDDFKISGTIWEGQYLYDLYKEASLPWEWHKALFDVAKEEGLVCFSSPFDKTAVDFLEELNCPSAYKRLKFISSVAIVTLYISHQLSFKTTQDDQSKPAAR